MFHLLVLESVVMDQEEGDHRQSEGHAVIGSGRPQSEDARDVREEDKQKQRSDVVAEFAAVLLAHVRHCRTVGKSDDNLDDRHADAGLPVGIRLADDPVGQDRQHGDCDN